MTTVWALLAIATIMGWLLCQMDVANAFLHVDLYEEVYMHLPLGYHEYGCRINTSSEPFLARGSDKVCRLLLSL